MMITGIHFEQTFNTGNYENQKIRVEAWVNEGEDPALILTQLRAFVAAHDPALVQARAVLATPDGRPAWELKQARQRLGLPEPEPTPAKRTVPADDDLEDL